MGQAASRQEAFWEACGFGHIKRVEKFIAEGIDVNWVSYTHDCCPIHVASQGKPEIVDLLLEQKCDVNVLDIRGNTPLHHAAMRGHSDIMQTLITAGCKIDTEDKNGWTALHNATYWCHYKAVKVLLKSRCDITVRNKDSRTALHEVARSKEKEEETLGEIARHLIKAGSDINARGSDLGEADFTGLMFASYHGHTDVASAFIEAGCDLNATGSSNNWSALHWAADRGQDAMVYLLLEAGIDPTIKAYRGQTAADRAKSPEIKETILNAINMFEELKLLESKCPQTKKSTSYTQNGSPSKNKLTNQMVDNIFSRIPPMKRPELAKAESSVMEASDESAKSQYKPVDLHKSMESTKNTSKEMESLSNESSRKDTDVSDSTSDNVSYNDSKLELANQTNSTDDSPDQKISSIELANQKIEETKSAEQIDATASNIESANQQNETIDPTIESANQQTDKIDPNVEPANQKTGKIDSTIDSISPVQDVLVPGDKKQDVKMENSTGDEDCVKDLTDEVKCLSVHEVKSESTD